MPDPPCSRKVASSASRRLRGTPACARKPDKASPSAAFSRRSVLSGVLAGALYLCDQRQSIAAQEELQSQPGAGVEGSGRGRPDQPPATSKPPAAAPDKAKPGAPVDEADRRRRKKGRIRELQELRTELAEKEGVLLSKEEELLDRDQTVVVLREELDLERKLRALLTKEKEKAEEEAALAMGLCAGGSMLP
ncbi:hypothetical protein WJX72_002744 [[Myrmecia] bisecta]|uniref:Uncharacterized protein n=1 Tax=[Myrmecia] bisecta TaxID=41462 RepID=A0AAW1P957_9CHLO